MVNLHQLSFTQCSELAEGVASGLYNRNPRQVRHYELVAIPRGGVPAAFLVAEQLRSLDPSITANVQILGDGRPMTSCIVVDDILVTGKTMEAALKTSRSNHAAVLVYKGIAWDPPKMVYYNYGDQYASNLWVQFPWEVNDPDQGTPEDAVRRLIEWAGEDPTRPGLVDTPRRVLQFLTEMKERAAYPVSATTFEVEHDDLVMVRNIPFHAMCEHHMLPFYGRAHVAYLPQDSKVLGLSKLVRFVNQESGGLSVQETITQKVAERVQEAVCTDSVGVITQAVHSCMLIRGVQAEGAETVISSMRGAFRKDKELRAEFTALVIGR